MDNFYDFNEEFNDGTTGIFRQQTAIAMQQPNDSGVTATPPLASAPSAAVSVISNKTQAESIIFSILARNVDAGSQHSFGR